MCCVCSFAGKREEVSQVRALVGHLLAGSPIVDDAVLLTSELAANACAHSESGRPGGRFTVRVCGNDGNGVYVEVEDAGSPWDGSFGKIKSPHGLYLLQTLSAACGARRGDQGWVTWFMLGGQGG